MTTKAAHLDAALADIDRARRDRDEFYAASGGDPMAVALRAGSEHPERTAAAYQAMRLRAEARGRAADAA